MTNEEKISFEARLNEMTAEEARQAMIDAGGVCDKIKDELNNVAAPQSRRDELLDELSHAAWREDRLTQRYFEALNEPTAPEINFSARFADRAHRASLALVRKIQATPYRSLKQLLASRSPHAVAYDVRLTYSASGSFESVTADIADPSDTHANPAAMMVYIDGDLDEEASRVLVSMYAAHARTLILRRLGERPYYLSPVERLTAIADGMESALRLIAEISDEIYTDEIVSYVMTQLAAEEIARRDGESNHALIERIAAGGRV